MSDPVARCREVARDFGAGAVVDPGAQNAEDQPPVDVVLDYSGV